MNIAEVLHTRAVEHPDLPAIVETVGTHVARDRVTTFGALEGATAQAAQLLWETGLRPGDRVLVLQPMSAELYVALLAIFRLGLVATFVDPSSGMEQVARCCELAAPRAFIGSPKAHLLRLLVPALGRIPHRFVVGPSPLPVPGAVPWERLSGCLPRSEIYDAAPDDPALLTFTSGSTGAPKAMVRSHGFLLAQHRVLERNFPGRPGAVSLTTLPIFVLADLASGMTSLIAAGDLHHPGTIDAAPVLAQIERYRPVRASASPAFWQRIIAYCQKQQAASDLSTAADLRGAAVGARPVSPAWTPPPTPSAAWGGAVRRPGATTGGTGSPPPVGEGKVGSAPPLARQPVSPRESHANLPVGAQPAALPLPYIKRIYAGGAPVFPRLLDELHTLAPQAEVVAVYGSTEAEPVAHIAHGELEPEDVPAMLAGRGLLVGRPVPEIELRILRDSWGTPVGPYTSEAFAGACVGAGEPGEIVVRGEHVSGGYLGGRGDDETKFLVDGTMWHRTGDAGYLDERGRLWLLGRCSARISDERGTLYPFAVEAALSAHPQVRRAAAVALAGRRILALELDSSDHPGHQWPGHGEEGDPGPQGPGHSGDGDPGPEGPGHSGDGDPGPEGPGHNGGGLKAGTRATQRAGSGEEEPGGSPIVEDIAKTVAWVNFDEVRVLRHIPVDKRHNAKIDYPALYRLLSH